MAATHGVVDYLTVLEVLGHQNSGALNEAVRKLHSTGVDVVFFLSGKAVDLIDCDTMDRVIEQFESGKKVVGVRIPELDDDIMPIQNTAAGWDAEALLGVGGFTSKIGVEEVTPLIELTRSYGCCAVLISGVPGQLDVRQSPEGQAKHAEVMATKRVRQEKEATRAFSSLRWLISQIEKEK